MLYKKNKALHLTKELFKNPTSEYRGTPFWAWNCELNQEELEWQLEILKQMGFGGAHMHVRTGMATKYLSQEHMDLIKACVRKAKKEEMLAWLYDEDRWPSGAAGGLVTKEKEYRSRYLIFTPVPYRTSEDKDCGSKKINVPLNRVAVATRAENGKLIACYDINLNQDGRLAGYKMIDKDTPAKYEKWYAYLELACENPWFNNQTYVNTLDKSAMDRFIEITYESYNRSISEEFDHTVPAIFTDEPQFVHKTTLLSAKEKKDVVLPWTDDFPDTFADAYEGEDILSGLPELIWEREDHCVSTLRYHYHDHLCERFVVAFTDNCGDWCKKHGLALTGHMMCEGSLTAQTATLSEVMRAYRNFGLPGIDMLCGSFEYTTAKQAQSAVHQYGREGMLSELYGVTNWDFDFRGHKLHGDWQAALGVTIRAPHLSWVSMAGEAKRDYPASINYQSPWWPKYSLVEDHFARVNTAMTRGKAVVKVGMIHPVESFWLHFGPVDQTGMKRGSMEENFQNITKWLLFGSVDFDFISESLLPELSHQASAPLKVGEMEYDVIIVPNCETLRTTTLERLEQFVNAGGRLIFVGELPTLENACPSKRGKELAKTAQCISFTRNAVLQALEDVREVEIRTESGLFSDKMLYQLRQDTDGRWLFVAHGKEPYNKDVSQFENLKICLKGRWKVLLYNTINGEIEDIEHYVTDNATEIRCRMYDYDSILLWLEPLEGEMEAAIVSKEVKDTVRKIDVPPTVPYTLSEPNALLLDQAEYALDDGEWNPKEEILKLDDACRRQLGWPSRNANFPQPWAIEKKPITHMLHLKWHIQSEIAYTDAKLAIEDAECLKLKWNGETISNNVAGWYVDKSIKTVTLPKILVGDNILEASIPFGETTNVEWAYLLGDFGVDVAGRHVRIVAARKELAFGDIVHQGLPFYGGNITYHVPVYTEGGTLRVRSSQYKGTLQTVNIDDREDIPLIYSPYTADCGVVDAGKHTVNLTLYGHRRNGFGPVHQTDLKNLWIGPRAWRTEGENWSYDYILCEEGVTTPEISVVIDK